jgi:SAM-dependent methyltransferase
VIDPLFRALARDVAARYKPAGRFAYHFALGKLTADPVFAHIVMRPLIPRGGRILDLGCGMGLLAALLDTARSGFWLSRLPCAPDFATYQGIDRHAPDIARAKYAVNGDARFLCGDIRREPFGTADAVILLDVLHYLEPGAQEQVLARARAALQDGGALLMRVADASSTLRFRSTVLVDRIVSSLRHRRSDRLHCRPLASWIDALEALGFDVDAAPMSARTPFANVLLVARYHRAEGNRVASRPSISTRASARSRASMR